MWGDAAVSTPGSHRSPHPQRCCEGLANVPRGSARALTPVAHADP